MSPLKKVILGGFGIMPAPTGDKGPQRKVMHCERTGKTGARLREWKSLETRRGGGLFDLSGDTGEKRDFCGEMPESAARVKIRFDAWRETMRRAGPRCPLRD